MKAEDYLTTMMQVGALASIACELPVEEARATLERSDVLGAILDPALYREAMADGTFELQRQLLDAMLTLKRAALRCRAHERGMPVPLPEKPIQRKGDTN